MGRKLFDGKNKKDVLTKLEEAWTIGCTDKEACLWAEISVMALQRFQNSNEKFRKRKELLKETLVLKSRHEVFKGVKNDKEFALKVLKCKKKNEWSERQDHLHLGDPDNPIEHKHRYEIIDADRYIKAKKKKKKM